MVFDVCIRVFPYMILNKPAIGLYFTIYFANKFSFQFCGLNNSTGCLHLTARYELSHHHPSLSTT